MHNINNYYGSICLLDDTVKSLLVQDASPYMEFSHLLH